MVDLRPYLRNALSDLEEAYDTAKWAHSAGYYPASTANKPIVSRSRPTSSRAPGGTEWSRAVLCEAAQYLTAAEVRVGVALAAIGMRTVPARGAPAVDAGDLARWRRAHAGLRWGLSQLLTAVEQGTVPQEHARALRAVLVGPIGNWMGSACWRLRMANDVLGEAFRGTERPSGDFVAPCKICRVRDVKAKAGGRCWTCATYRARNGFERPRSLDKDHLSDSKAAKERREARGEGWGAA